MSMPGLYFFKNVLTRILNANEREPYMRIETHDHKELSPAVRLSFLCETYCAPIVVYVVNRSSKLR